MANVIEVIIRAKDESKAAFQSASAGLADLKKFTSGLPQQLGSVADAIGPAGLVAGIAAVSFTAAAVATKGFLDVVRQGADVGDALNRIAEQTGLTAEEVSRLKFAATQTNTSIESLNVGIRFLSKNLFEAQRGGKEQAETLRELGFSGAEAAGNLGGTSEALLKIADRLRLVEDPGTRTALAMRLFGRSAQELVPLLNQGSAGIRALGDEADRAGITVSSAAAKLGDSFNDAILKINQQFDGMKAKIAEAALPALIEFVNVASVGLGRVATIISENREAFARFAELLARTGSVVINITVRGADILDGIIQRLETIMRNPLVAGAILSNPFARWAITNTQSNAPKPLEIVTGKRETKSGAPDAPVVSDEAAKRLKAAEEAAAKFRDTLQQAYLVSDRIGASLKDALGVEKATEFVAAMQKVEQELAKSPLVPRAPTGPDGKPVDLRKQDEFEPAPAVQVIDVRLEGVDQASAAIATLIEELEAAGVNGERLRDVLAQSGETAFIMEAGFSAAFANLNAALDPARNLIADLSDAMFTFVDDFMAGVGDAFTSLVVGGQRLTDTLKGFLLGVLQTVKRLIADIAVAITKALILKALGFGIGFSGGGSVGVASGGQVRMAGGGSVAGGATSSIRNVFQTINHFVSGGSVLSGAGGARQGSTAASRLVAGLSLGGSVAGSGAVHLASGGSLVTNNIVHAAGGVRVIGGNPQAYDSVPAMLAPGEVVLPTIGGRSPGDLLAGLAQLGKDLTSVMARQFVPQQAALATAGGGHTTYNISALDAASFRTLERRGDLGRERALASDPARD